MRLPPGDLQRLWSHWQCSLPYSTDGEWKHPADIKELGWFSSNKCYLSGDFHDHKVLWLLGWLEGTLVVAACILIMSLIVMFHRLLSPVINY